LSVEYCDVRIVSVCPVEAPVLGLYKNQSQKQATIELEQVRNDSLALMLKALCRPVPNLTEISLTAQKFERLTQRG